MNYLFIFIYITHKNNFFVCDTYPMLYNRILGGIFCLLFLCYVGDNILTAVPKFILEPFHNYL